MSWSGKFFISVSNDSRARSVWPSALERDAALVVRVGHAVALRIVGDDAIIGVDRFGELAVLLIALADVPLRVVGQIGAREVPQVGVEALDTERPLAGGEVGQRGVVQPLRRHAGGQRPGGGGTGGAAVPGRRAGALPGSPADAGGVVGNCGMASRSASTSCDSAGDADVVLVDALADDAQVAAELIDGELLIGERLPRGGACSSSRALIALSVAPSCSIAAASCCCSCWVCSCSMRMSAIICISRRDCAAAGAAAEHTISPSARMHGAKPEVFVGSYAHLTLP